VAVATNEVLDDAHFVLGEELRVHLVDPRVSRDGASGRLGVASDHDHVGHPESA